MALRMEHVLIVTCDFCKERKEIFTGEIKADEAAQMMADKGWTVNMQSKSMKCPSCNHSEDQYNETSHLRN